MLRPDRTEGMELHQLGIAQPGARLDGEAEGVTAALVTARRRAPADVGVSSGREDHGVPRPGMRAGERGAVVRVAGPARAVASHVLEALLRAAGDDLGSTGAGRQTALPQRFGSMPLPHVVRAGAGRRPREA